MVMARTMRVKTGDAEIDDEEKMLKAEKALHQYGIAIKEEGGGMRSFMDIMADLSDVWGGLNEQQQNYIADALGGARQLNIVLGLVKSKNRIDELTNIGENAGGETVAAQAVWAEGLEGRLEKLKGVAESFWQDFLHSETLASGIDLITELIKGLNWMTNNLGTATMAIGGFAAAFMMLTNNPLTNFGNKLRENVNSLNSFSGGMKQTTEQFIAMGVSADTNINALTRSQKVAAGLKGAFSGLRLQALATSIAIGAMEAALSIGLSAAIMGIISGVKYLYENFIDLSGAMDEASGYLDSFKQSAESIKDESKLVQDYEKLSKEMEAANTSAERKKEIQTELEGISNRLVTYEKDYKTALGDSNTTLEDRLKKIKEIEENNQKEAKFKLKSDLDEKLIPQDQAERLKEQLEGALQGLENFKKAKEDLDSDDRKVRNKAFRSVGNESQANERIAEQEKKVTELAIAYNEYNDGVSIYKDNNLQTEKSMLTLSSASQEQLDNFKNSTEALKENTDAQKENNKAKEDGTDKEIAKPTTEESTKAYNEALKKIVQAEDMIKEMNSEQGFTRDLAIEIMDVYPEIGYRINSVAETQAFLNEKIREQKTAAEEAFEAMIGNDENYYNEKIRQNESFQEYLAQYAQNFISINGTALNTDLEQYSTYSQMKAGIMGQLDDVLIQYLISFIGGNQETYKKDLADCKTWAEKKALILQKLDNAITSINNRMTATIELGKAAAKSGNNVEESHQEKFYTNQINELERLQGAYQNFGKMDLDFSGMDAIGMTKPKLPNVGGGSKDKKGSGSKNAVDDLEDLTEALYNTKNAIDQVNDALDYNSEKMTYAYGEQKQQLLEERIKLLEQEKDLQLQMADDIEKRKNSLAKELRQQGFEMDAYGNIENRNELVEYYRKKANAKTGDAKKKAQDDLKDLIKVTEEYTKLVRDEMPKTTLEYEKLNNEIKKAYKEQASLVQEQEKKIYDMIQYYANKKVQTKKDELNKAKELTDKQYEEENYENEKADAEKELERIKKEMDRYANDTSRKGQAKYKELMEEYKNQQKTLTDMINEHAKDKMDDRFDEEMDLLDKELEEFLKPENINAIIDEAIRTGLVNVFGEVVKVDDAMTKWMAETEIGLINANIQMNELIENLKTVESLYGNMSDISKGAGLQDFVINNDILKLLGTSISSQNAPITMSGGDIIIQGNVTPEVLPDLEKMQSKWKNDVIKDITKAIKK